MKVKWGTVLIIVLMAAATMLVAYAITSCFLTYPTTATVQGIALTTTLDGAALANQTTISWGNVVAGQSYGKTLVVHNTGAISATVTLSLVGLPSGWTCTWAQSGSIVAAGNTLTGTLTLTVPTDAIPQPYNWVTNINGT